LLSIDPEDMEVNEATTEIVLANIVVSEVVHICLTFSGSFGVWVKDGTIK
tara:strand:- start:36 stop:185 length:150 start_codon:yes stop_codon:yes gene_type:complete